MIKKDVILVGGGPAGAACAWRLQQHGVDCLVLDGQAFPRFKPCAGWVTPELLRDLALRVDEYPFNLIILNEFDIRLGRFRLRLPTRQYAIRRIEFDHFLLKRSGAPLIRHSVHEIRVRADGYEIDGAYFGRYLIGAGGTHCPVNRQLFEPQEPRRESALVVAMEEEFHAPRRDGRCRLWFFQNHLPGYAWYIPKADGWLNVGVGGMAGQLKANGDSLRRHWELLVEKLEKMGLVRGHAYHPEGHSYYLHQERRVVHKGNTFIVGDAAGLATHDLGEGIHPAVQSGLRAADAILQGSEYTLAGIHRLSLWSLLRLAR
jgi:flavin-dependent dehydrogenase